MNNKMWRWTFNNSFVVDAPTARDAIDMFLAVRGGERICVDIIVCSEPSDLSEPERLFLNAQVEANAAALASVTMQRDELQEQEPPAQAWYRGANYMRTIFHSQAKLPDDSPLWTVDVPDYMPP